MLPNPAGKGTRRVTGTTPSPKNACGKLPALKHDGDGEEAATRTASHGGVAPVATRWVKERAALARINRLLRRNGGWFCLRKVRLKGQRGGGEYRLYDLFRGEPRGGPISNLDSDAKRIGASYVPSKRTQDGAVEVAENGEG